MDNEVQTQYGRMCWAHQGSHRPVLTVPAVLTITHDLDLDKTN
jgi:hypothetical protein